MLDEQEAELDVHHALNDFTVHKAVVAARVTRLDLSVEAGGRREEIGSFSGDGVILSSPTGIDRLLTRGRRTDRPSDDGVPGGDPDLSPHTGGASARHPSVP